MKYDVFLYMGQNFPISDKTIRTLRGLFATRTFGPKSFDVTNGTMTSLENLNFSLTSIDDKYPSQKFDIRLWRVNEEDYYVIDSINFIYNGCFYNVTVPRFDSETVELFINTYDAESVKYMRDNFGKDVVLSYERFRKAGILPDYSVKAEYFPKSADENRFDFVRICSDAYASDLKLERDLNPSRIRIEGSGMIN